MPYLTPTVTARGTISTTGEDGSWQIVATGAVAAGSTLVLVGGAFTGGGQAARITAVSDTSSNTWSNLTNSTGSGEYSPNAILAVAANVTAGTPTVTITSDMSTDCRPNLILLEVTNVETSSVVDVIVQGQGDGVAYSVTSDSTGPLSQTDYIAIVTAAGWFGDPDNPTTGGTWTERLSIENGSGAGLLGTQVSTRVVTGSTSAISVTVPTPDAATTNSYCILLILKAKSTTSTSLRYKFVLDDSVFTSADTSITGFVWRGGTPDAVLAQRFTGLAGDASAGILYITTDIPAAAATTDVLYGIFYNGTDTSGLIGGVVEAY